MRQKLIRVTLFVLLIAGLGGGVWAAVWWARYPKVPNVKAIDPNESIAFLGSDDFNRMTRAHRLRFLEGIIDRLRDKQFSDLVALMIERDERRKQIGKNVNRLDKADREKVGSQFMQLFLDKFYEQDPTKRTAYLVSVVLLQKAGTMSKGAREMGLPKPDELKNAMGNFLSNQPPKAQAQMSQFMLDLGKQQRAFGMKPGW